VHQVGNQYIVVDTVVLYRMLMNVSSSTVTST